MGPQYCSVLLLGLPYVLLDASSAAGISYSRCAVLLLCAEAQGDGQAREWDAHQEGAAQGKAGGYASMRRHGM